MVLFILEIENCPWFNTVCSTETGKIIEEAFNATCESPNSTRWDNNRNELKEKIRENIFDRKVYHTLPGGYECVVTLGVMVS